ncbi:protein phosphatase 2C [Neocallimastix lanati (nom. inval.)]|jgi:protein phosphatase PTC1|uniref:Protein phosphatase 2C n=1 Tax=Neocallimastix californiae TaxID=1754190 RepID=A0A1Y2CHI8_9FUNG|nr:protein phosphatase 2C [Neocallimastix sp. JGI-2020a]ORY46294.1 protein phosphatase 2C [Neocallimastix californiae]|eukprot:ORY46294.1 protein phosphatase 2C [Neocallimastix californiae]
MTDIKEITTTVIGEDDDAPVASIIDAKNSEEEEEEVEDTTLLNEIKKAGFSIGFSEDRNKRCRRTMEDAHAYFYNFNDVEGQGYFAIFDGHAGKQAAEWCGKQLHENLIEILKESPDMPIQESLNKAFLKTDSQLNEKRGIPSGCTAIVVLVRKEKIKDENNNEVEKRVLYSANVGDARAVLSRNGHALRLSCDHKGSNREEVQRITDAGGFVLNARVNGVLAVTRSLGDYSMKEWVIGNPYTSRVVLDDNDKFLILACDGVWDVCSDDEAVELIENITDPQEASEVLLKHALENFSTDNLSVLIVRFHE